jgi:P27 family predicted phage terminase small subunit
MQDIASRSCMNESRPMSNPPIPLRLKLLRGNPGRRRLNHSEPQPTIPPEPPDAPDFLMPAARDEWYRLVDELRALGMLTTFDTAVLAAYCQSYGRWRQAEEMLTAMCERDAVTGALLVKTASGNTAYNPLIAIARRAAADMVRYAAEFGFSPAARTRIQSGLVAQIGSGGKFDGLLA